MVVINKGHSRVEIVALETRILRDILKRAVLLVVEKKHTPVETYGEIGSTVIVIIASSAADGVQCRIEADFLGHVFELAVAQIVIQGHSAFFAIVGQEEVGPTIVVIVKEARARPELRSNIFLR